MLNLDDILNTVNNLKDTEEKKNKLETSAIDPRILRFKKGCKYYGRFVPTAKDPLVTYEEIGFTSRLDGTSYVYTGRAYADPLLQYKGPNLINKTQWDAWKLAKASGDEAAMKETYRLIPQRKQLVNFFLTKVVGDDNAAKEDIGKLKVVRYPAALDKEKNPKSAAYKAISEGLFGSGKKKIGGKGFLLPNTIEDGVNFCFDVTDKGGYPNYDQSHFDLLEESEPPQLTKEQVMELLQSAYDLNEFVPALKSPEEIKELMDTHWFGSNASAEDEVATDEPMVSDEDDTIPFLGTSSGKDFDEELDELLK